MFSDSYQRFGENNGTPTGSETYKFTGKPVSTTTGLYYYGARWYDASIGRFISQDPMTGLLSDPQRENGYVYASNSPTVLRDLAGLKLELLKLQLMLVSKEGATPEEVEEVRKAREELRKGEFLGFDTLLEELG